MPSASSKSEKSASTEATDPLKQAIVIIEHKIRNLEKRKSKLDSYKESIKSLTKEQVEAISKYDEVVQQLELSKEYVKQFAVISLESDKLKKKQAKKDAQEKFMAEVSKVKQVLLIQDVLQNMGTDAVREDFLAGHNGAIQLTEADLKTLDDLYIDVSPKRVQEDSTTSPNDNFQKAAEYLMAIIEGKTKEMAGSTGAKLRDLMNSIHACGYFDQLLVVETNATATASDAAVGDAPASNAATSGNLENEKPLEGDNHENLNKVIVPNQNLPEGNMMSVPNPAPTQPLMTTGVPILPSGAQPPVIQPNQQQNVTPNVTTIIPTPVSQVESSFFNAQGFKPPAPPSVVPPITQSSRQINDVIQSVAGKFNFLQESELDVADMNPGVPPANPPVVPPQISGAPPSTIPSQTFTNQNFNGQPGGTPNFPPNYPPQTAAFQAFVPAFPGFVPPNSAPTQNPSTKTNSNNPAPINSSVNPNIPTSNNNININSSSKCNNIPSPIPMTPNRNPNGNLIQNQQQMSSTCVNQQNAPKMSQPLNQPGFQHNKVTVCPVENVKVDGAARESEVKEKQEKEKQDWNQQDNRNWVDDWTETTEWNSTNQNQSDGPVNSNKFSSGRMNRNGGAVPRNANGYQGNRNRTNRQGGYRDSQNNHGGGSGSGNYFQNQNEVQSRNDRSNEYSTGGKGNLDPRDGTFKERGDFSNRDRDSRDNYGGGYKRGPPTRTPKGPMDRGDRQGPIPRNNPNGPRGPRNLNRQPGVRGGPTFQRQQPNVTEQPTNK